MEKFPQEQTEEIGVRFERLLEEYDPDFLKEWLRRVALKSGIEKALPQVSIAEIHNSETLKAQGKYEPGKGRIFVNIEKIEKSQETPDTVKKQFFHVLIHEGLHAASTPDAYQSGFMEYFGGYMLWNEGVTEKIAREVSQEYFLAKGYGEFESMSGAYDIPVSFVDFVIEHLAEKTEVGKELVWNALIRAYFYEHELDFSGNENIVPADFYKKLKYAGIKDLEKGFENFEDKSFKEFVGMPEEKQGSGFEKFVEFLRSKLGL